MNDKLTLNKLEKLIELETQLRGEYQQQLDDKDVSIAQLSVDKTTLEAQIAEREKTIATQLATITAFSSKAASKSCRKILLQSVQNWPSSKNMIHNDCAKIWMPRKRSWQTKLLLQTSCKNRSTKRAQRTLSSSKK